VNRLLEIGFQLAGHWRLNNDQPLCELVRLGTHEKALYAFVCDGQIKYIGKTKSTLQRRMASYKTSGKGGSTNMANHQRIKEQLRNGVAVDILVLPDSGLLHYGRFHLNLAAALEDNLIDVIQPEWNGGRKERIVDIEEDDILPIDTSGVHSVFTFTLHPTYYRSGFFNVGVDSQSAIGADGEVIELHLNDDTPAVLGNINRRANVNGTPRIMGGVGLRDWFVSQAKVMDSIQVEVLAPNAIRLAVARGEGEPKSGDHGA
jgi:hypothetical protein